MTTSDSITNCVADLTTEEFILTLFCKVDDQCLQDPELKNKHPQAKLYPSELITSGCFLRSKAVASALFTGG